MRPVGVLAFLLAFLLGITSLVVPVQAGSLERHVLTEDHTTHQLPPKENPPKPGAPQPNTRGPGARTAATTSADVVPPVTQGLSTTHDRHLSAPTFHFDCNPDPDVHYLLVEYDGPTVSTSTSNTQRWFDHNYCDSNNKFVWTSEILGAFDNSVVTCRSWFIITHHHNGTWGSWNNGISYQNGGNNHASCPTAGV